MASGKIPGVRTISHKQVLELSKLPWTRDEELSTGGFEARLLPDGRVLMVLPLGGSGTLYPSREPLAKMLREMAESSANGPVDHARILLPPIDDFLRDVEAHAKSLGPRLRIPDEVLDGTPESLDAVDKALKRIPWAKRQVPDLVTPLVAYLGEVIRKGTGGQWIKPSTTTRKRQVPVYDPAELAAWQEAGAVGQRAFTAAQEKLGGGSSPAMFEAYEKAVEATGVPEPKPIRFDVIEEFISSPKEVRIYDPVELMAHDAAKRRVQPIAIAAADKAAAEAKARGASAHDVKVAWSMARAAAFQDVDAAAPKPIRIDVREENEPMITTRGGGLFQPFASVFLPMVEPSRRIPLRSSPGVPHDRPGIKPKPVG
jgi:hypothetical protein